MTPPPWHVTHSAAQRYAFLQRWMVEDISRAKRELASAMSEAKYKARDRYGRELWRSPRGGGSAAVRSMRWIIDPRVPKPLWPELVWVGRGAPPVHLWSPT